MNPHYLQNLTRSTIATHTGDLSQLAGVRLMTLNDGTERDVRVADVRSGAGLRFQVTLDRGMDISMAEYRGVPLAWRSPVGDVHPAFYDPQGLGWLGSFAGGLMTGCGMTHLGSPCVDDGESLGLHGRLSHLPADNIRTHTEWQGDQCRFIVEGTMKEYSPFREHLTMHRTIEVALGGYAVAIRDTATNEGSSRTPFMLLYHINAGWPLVDTGARLRLHARKMQPRDAIAEKGVASARLFEDPQAGYQEQVFYHELEADPAGYVTTLLHNPKIELGLFVRYRQAELPRFVEWKMMGNGTYVVGMEPANCHVGGRDLERAQGTLQYLEPGESRSLDVQIGVIDGPDAIEQFTTRYRLE
jgi:hypothetical protein